MDNDVSNLISYLLERGFLTPQSLVDGDVIVAKDRSRHQSFAVIRKQGASYFAKRIQDWQPDAAETLEREGSCYRLVDENSAFEPLRSLLPKLHTYDSKRHILLLELLQDAENLSVYHRRVQQFPVAIAEKLGSTLGACHRTSIDSGEKGKQDLKFPRQVPWALSAYEGSSAPPVGLSPANTQLIGLIRKDPVFAGALERLCDRWEASTLIHGDMKWENCVVYPRQAPPEDLHLKIVDWEIADLGDPCWDVGSIFQSYLAAWIFSIPVDGSGEARVANARHPLTEIQPALQAFWRSYVKARGVKSPHQAVLLEKCVSYAGARMIQNAFEHMVYSTTLSPHALCLLQMSSNILHAPASAVTQLLAI